MRKVSTLILCQFYLPALLLAAAIMSTPVYLAPALLLLLAVVFSVFRPLSPRFNIVLYTIVLLLTPLILAAGLERLTGLVSVTASILSAILTAPAVYLIDHYLQEKTRQDPEFTVGKGRATVTPVFISLAAAALVLMVLSPVVAKPVLLTVGGVLLLYLLGTLLRMLIALRRSPLTTTAITKRIIADTTGSVSVELSGRAPLKLYSRFETDTDWFSVSPTQTTINEGKTRLDLTFAPPLSGNTSPQLKVSSLDPRGLVQVNQVMEPLHLQVIPRAKYAAWLAQKYLTQAGSGEISTGMLTSIKKPQRGTEYIESRSYQPGDPLRDIDWKHTTKLSQIIVKEYREAGEPAAIIAVNLAVPDAVAADRLAFNIVSTALTLAREGIPAALTAYNRTDTVLVTGIIPPQELVQRALSLLDKITLVKTPGRHLAPADIARLRRNIHQLKNAASEPAQRLLEIFNFEKLSMEGAARENPAARAITGAVKQVPPPAMILLVSELNHDAEAVMVIAERLAVKNYTTVPLNGH